ncbi:MAG: mprA 2 [Firmicutes bacterium]|nr:mprA 2 [Bacillota bacterium]
MTLLLVEDNQKFAERLVNILKRNGYVVDVAINTEIAMDMAATGIYDIILLARMLPGCDGIYFVKEFRNLGFDTPVMILSINGSSTDVVECLDAGADDYLIKPFYTDELLARVRALTRRKSCTAVTKNIKLADVVLDPWKKIANVNDEEIQLTGKETKLLELLMHNYGRVISNSFILERVWGYNSTVSTPTIHQYIYNLRKKLNNDYIKTIPKIGYMFKPE